MRRRELLQVLASTSAGAGLVALGGGSAVARSLGGARAAADRARPGAIETKDGVRLFVRDWGRGRPVVFVHGWSLSSEAWQYQMLPLAAAGLRSVAYDRRGHGRSDDPGRGFDYDTMADDLAAVFARLDLRHAVLVGQSMGAGDAVRYLRRHGASRVDRLVLVSPALPFLLKTDDNPDGIERQVFDHVIATFCADLPKWMRDNAPPYFVPETVARYHRVGPPHRPAGVAQGARRRLSRAHRNGPAPGSASPDHSHGGDPRRSRPFGAIGLHRPQDRGAGPGCRARGLRGRATRDVHHAQGAAQPGSAGDRCAMTPAAGPELRFFERSDLSLRPARRPVGR